MWNHSPSCPILGYRAGLALDLLREPTNVYLRGAWPEYFNGGDQEAENCTCVGAPWNRCADCGKDWDVLFVPNPGPIGSGGVYLCDSCETQRRYDEAAEPRPAPGERIRLAHAVDRYPHFVAPAGATGTVVDIGDARILAVRMDEVVEGAEEWDNEVHWSDGDDPGVSVSTLVEVEVPFHRTASELALDRSTVEHGARPIWETLDWLRSTGSSDEDLERIMRAAVVLQAAQPAASFAECFDTAVIWERG